jgi:hypothetical protein
VSPSAAVTSPLERFIDRLATASWPGGGAVDRQAERFLSLIRVKSAEFRAELSGLAHAEFDRLAAASRETPTHYKWHLHTVPGKAFVIWLHEYKPAPLRGGGYATSIHNHRYGLSSLVLSGGYRHLGYAVERDARGGVIAERTWTRDVRPGSCYSIDAEDFHQITDLVDGTVTLVVQHPAVRTYSTSVDLSGHRLVHHYPVESRYDELRRLLNNGGIDW